MERPYEPPAVETYGSVEALTEEFERYGDWGPGGGWRWSW